MTQHVIPFLGNPQQRGTGTGDERFVNVLFEPVKTPSPSEHPFTCFKRPGLAAHSQPSGSTATGRGLYAWGATGKIYSVFDNKIYANGSDMGVTLAASSGRCWFVEKHVSTGTQHLIMCDGTDNYNITTADAITQIDENDDADYPTSNLGCIVFLDGYLFQAQSNGKLWNTDLNSATAWTSTSFLSVAEYGSDLEAIWRQKDQIVAASKNRLQFYFDNGNPTASPLLLIDQNTLGFGIATKNSLATYGEVAMFVGDTPGEAAARRVYLMQSLQVKEISTPYINRFLQAEGSSISSCTAWMGQVAGQLVYVLNLASASRTFVYSIDHGYWCEWQVAGAATKFTGGYATSLNGTTYVQDVASGDILTLSPTTYQDDSTNFTVTLQTNRLTLGDPDIKRQVSLDVIGDNTTGNLAVSYSDDDYANFSTARNIDMSRNEKRLKNLGAFYGRAFKFTFTDNYSLRLMGFVISLPEDDMRVKKP